MSLFAGKIVVVTGGSAGFGFILANAFAKQGANVFVLARDAGNLQKAVERSPHPLVPLVCDVCCDQAVRTAVDTIIQDKQRIDVWVNNVGISTRVALSECTLAEYAKQMEVNFFSAVRCSMEVLTAVTKSSGSIVNIGSLAAKTAWPAMAPYCTSKHALAAFTHQLRIESGGSIHAMFVCCGPIRREDAGQRYEVASATLDESARKPGAGVKLKGLDPEWLATQIMNGIVRKKKELVVPFYARFLFAIQQLSPSLGDWLLRKFKK